MDEYKFNFLFVSDLHVGPGYDPDLQMNHPREDFHYDNSFFRFLRWADSNREDEKPWELVFVGDAFDFLPIEIGNLNGSKSYFTNLANTITKRSPAAIIGEWDRFLSPPLSQSPIWFRRQILKLYLDEGLIEADYYPYDRDDESEHDPFEVTHDRKLLQDEEDHFIDDITYEGDLLWYRDNLTGFQVSRQEREHVQMLPVPWWAIDIFRENLKDPLPDDDETYPQLHQIIFNLRFNRLRWWKKQFKRFLLRWGRKWNRLEARLSNDTRTWYGGVHKLFTVYRGHPNFFKGLAWWAGRGNRLVFLLGNHDLELFWPKVQAEFKNLLWLDHLEMVMGGLEERLERAIALLVSQYGSGDDTAVQLLVKDELELIFSSPSQLAYLRDTSTEQMLEHAVAEIIEAASLPDAQDELGHNLRKASRKITSVVRAEIYEQTRSPHMKDTFGSILKAAKAKSLQLAEDNIGLPLRPQSSADKLPSQFGPQDARLLIHIAILWLSIQDDIVGMTEELVKTPIGNLPIDRSELEFAAFIERISFDFPWFYYKKGAFYAEHGAQYDNFNASSNLLSPYLPSIATHDVNTINLPFGSLGVTHLVAPLEDRFPDWESFGAHSTSLIRMLQEQSFRFLRMALANGERLIRDWIQLFRDTKEDKGPTQDQIKNYAAKAGLPSILVNKIQTSWDMPLMMRRFWSSLLIIATGFLWVVAKLIESVIRLVKWFFSPLMVFIFIFLFLFAVGIAAIAFSQELTDIWSLIWNRIQELRTHPVVALILFIAGSSLLIFLIKRLAEFLVWGLGEGLRKYSSKKGEKFFHPFLYPNTYLYKAAGDVHRLIETTEYDAPRFYVMGHDHRPAIRRIRGSLLGGAPIFYYNTGSWLASSMDEGQRFVRTKGLNVEYPFLQITYQFQRYEAHLRNWNDFTREPEDLTILFSPED